MATAATLTRAPGALPLLGHTVPLLRDPLGFLSSLPAHGDLVHVHLGPVRTLAVCDPELTRQVLLDDRTFDKGGIFYDKIRESFGDGIGACPHSRHRRQRRLIQPAFHPSRLPTYARAMTEHVTDVVGSWRDGQTLDVFAELQTTTARVLTATMFADFQTDDTLTEIIDDFLVLKEGAFRRMLMPPLVNRLPTPGNRRYHRARARLRRTTERLAADRRRLLKANDREDHGDLLSTLLLSRDGAAPEQDERSFLSDAEISGNLMIFFFAGVETTAATLAWALHLIARHPHVEERLHSEADAVLAGHAATFDDVARLTYTRRVINETMRLYPAGWLFTRITTADTHLGGHPIPAGTTMLYSPYVIHHRSDLFEESERFDPDRWDDATRPKPPPSSLIPFGAGARKCIGDQFGVTEAVQALATIAALWRLESLPGERVRPAPAMALSPRGLRMRVTARTPPPNGGGQTEHDRETQPPASA
jgi:cytochrome P450